VARALLKLPATAKPGEVIEIRTLIQHPMETGYRPGPNGKLLPRDIIRRFTCTYDGEMMFSAELHPAIAANPFISFTTVATVTGLLTFTWEGDNGFSQTETATLTVA
jgi:sulfur-oxidizing protein SoxZ